MRILSVILGLTLCFGLISCDKSENNSSKTQTEKSMPMQHLTMLLEHAISMMAQGAELKLSGQKNTQEYGDAMLAQSADLLRRAMSGSEMAAMHKGGQGQSPAMQRTHSLGAAAFDLLDLMMSLPMNKQASKADNLLHHALNMAAQGASMKSLAGMGMSKDIDIAMQAHGFKIQQAALRLSHDVKGNTPYDLALLKLIRILTK